MATWMYNAALICGPCAERTKEELKTAAGWKYRDMSQDFGDIWTAPGGARFDGDGNVIDSSGELVGTDTDTFPSDCTGLSSESDSVEFCDSGADCIDAFTPPYIPGGPKAWPIGAWLENDLTGDGIAGLKASIKASPRNPVVAFCRAQYRDALSWS